MKTLSYSTYRNKCKTTREITLQSEIRKLEENLCEHNKENLQLLQTELQNLRLDKMKGHFIRSRAEWIDNGEKTSNLFLSTRKTTLYK